MPEQVTQKYHFGGWQTVTLWSEEEMAKALGISVTELRARLDPHEYGKPGLYEPVGLSFHEHPFANAQRKFYFRQESFLENIKRWSCVKEGGHFFEPDLKYSYLPKGAETCSNCGYTRYG